MSFIDAKSDGIEIVQGAFRCSYLIPCEICGRKIRRTQYSRKRTYICDYCKGLIKEKEKAVIKKELLEVKTLHEERFDKAVDRIFCQVDNPEEYDNAIRIAKTRCEYYDSIPEAMVAIELLKLKYKIIPQQKIGRYKVDFAIPSIKKVIEVDGSLYHKQINNEREAKIQFSLGLDWKIIHVPAELIEKDIQKLKQIIETFS